MRMKHIALGITFLALTGAVSAARAQTAPAQINDKQFAAAFEKYVASEEGQVKLAKAVEDAFKAKQMRDQQAQFEEYFKNPVKIEAGSSPVKGPANAPITIIEFSDFQCPFCKRGKETMDAVLKEYPTQVKLVFKNLPLPMHPQAKPAAKAALAAGKQGKFWEMHDALFASHDKLAPALYEEKAKELGLDVAKFKADMESTEVENQVKSDAADATAFGIQGTPGFFVNGVPVKGAYPIEHFKSIIDRLLKGPPAAPPKGPQAVPAK